MKFQMIALAPLLTACLRSLGPDVGPLQAGPTIDAPAGSARDGSTPDVPAGCDTDSDPSVSVSFSADIVGTVIQHGHCANCHTSGGVGVQQSGFDLSSYTKLRAGGNNSHAGIVVDFMPCSSIIWEKIGPSPPFGKRMPYNGPPYLSAADIQLVHDWIAEGARDN